MEEQPALHTKNLSFAAEGRTILDDVDMDVRKGEFLTLIGPNGAGKTTLLRCFVGINQPGKNQVFVQNKDVLSYAQKDLARRVSYVAQRSQNRFGFRVREFVMMGRYPYLRRFAPPRREDYDAVDHALESVHMGAYRDRFINTLSGGELQKVWIAGALAQDAEILLLDECTVFLDPKHQSEIMSIIWKINRERGVTVVFITHDINSALLYGDRVLVVKDGKVPFCDAPDQLIQEGVLEDIFQKSFLYVEHPQSKKPMIVPEVFE